MKAHFQSLSSNPQESKSKMMSIFWLITQFFLFCYSITAMVFAGGEYMGFMAIWLVFKKHAPRVPKGG